MDKHVSSQSKRNRRKFVSDKVFNEYAKPKMVKAAEDLLCKEEISEEAFLGAQGVLLINGIL